MKDIEWDIKSRSDLCSNCEKPFEESEKLNSCLVFGQEGYTRHDYCCECAEHADRAVAVSRWTAVYRLPPPPKPEPLAKETAEELLRKLITEDQSRHTNTIYILAVMLERRKEFIEKDVEEREDGVKIRIYEQKITGDIFLIRDPELKLAEIEEVQKEVIAMLSGKDPYASDEQSEKAGEQQEQEENPATETDKEIQPAS